MNMIKKIVFFIFHPRKMRDIVRLESWLQTLTESERVAVMEGSIKPFQEKLVCSSCITHQFLYEGKCLECWKEQTLADPRNLPPFEVFKVLSQDPDYIRRALEGLMRKQ